MKLILIFNEIARMLHNSLKIPITVSIIEMFQIYNVIVEQCWHIDFETAIDWQKYDGTFARKSILQLNDVTLYRYYFIFSLVFLLIFLQLLLFLSIKKISFSE